MEFPLRHRIRDALLRTNAPALVAFADAIIARDGDRMACWGNLADHVRSQITVDADRIELWRVLVDIGDRRALLLFLDLNRDRPSVLRAIFDAADGLAPVIQCALVTMPEAAPLLRLPLPHLGSAARELIASGAESIARDRATYEAHMSALRGQRAATFTNVTSNHPEVPEATTTGDLP